jgi:hypothetical protein
MSAYAMEVVKHCPKPRIKSPELSSMVLIFVTNTRAREQYVEEAAVRIVDMQFVRLGPDNGTCVR